MGFDLTGKNPTSEKGQSFHLSGWSWRPLCDYVLRVCDDFLPREGRGYWHTNHGHFVSARMAKAIAARLREFIASGCTAEFAELYNDAQATATDKPCDVCNGTGHKSDLPQSIKEYFHGCPKCYGTGIMKPTIVYYRFSVDNVEAFAEFCEASGGFEIW